MKTCKYIVLFSLIIYLSFNSDLFSQAKIEGIKRQGLLYLQSAKYNQALTQFNKYISAKPQSADGYNFRGLCYEAKLMYENAYQDFKRAVFFDPVNKDYRDNLERIKNLWHNEIYDKIAKLKRDIELYPDKSENYLDMGKCHAMLEYWEFAEKWYDEYFKKETNADAEDVLKYSEIIAKTGSLVKGEKLLKFYVDKYPNDWRLQSRFGYIEYWLGKYNLAENAFQTAITLRPNFKEAEDGLLLSRSKGRLTLYQPRSFETSESIDGYYNTLKENPGDDAVRFLLVKELLKAERYEEASQQIQYLQPNYQQEERYQQLAVIIEQAKEKEYNSKIEELRSIANQYPGSRETIWKLVEYYSGLQQFGNAEEILKSYLELFPDDDEMRFLYAQVLTNDRKLEDAYPQMQLIIEKDPGKTSYKLLAGQLGVWLDRDSANTRTYLGEVIDKEPNNVNALVALGKLFFQRSDIDSAKICSDRIRLIDPANPDLIQLVTLIENEKLRKEQEQILIRLEQGEKLVKEEKYEEALPYYEEAMRSIALPPEIKIAYADLLLKLNNYKGAVTVYDSLIARQYNLDYDKQRGKIYILMGDSLTAKNEFERMAKDNPEDIESQVYLADCYAKLKKPEDARKIYKKVQPAAPEEFMIEDRIDALPPEPGSFGSFMSSFANDCFSYLNIKPYGFYFSDDLEFDYKYAAISLETSLNYAISLTGNYLRGNIGSVAESLMFSEIRGTINIRTSRKTVLGFGYGKANYGSGFDTPVMNAFVKYDDADRVNVSLKYSLGDGAEKFYSPGLVKNRIKAHEIRLDASYNYENKLKAYGFYQLLFAEKSNIYFDNQFQLLSSNVGNHFMIRIGKAFYPELFVGYEYYYADYKHNLPVYYTPEEFSSHSLWCEWKIADDYEWQITAGGRIGYVPMYDYIIRNADIKVRYKVFDRMNLELTGSIGNFVRFNSTYKSGYLFLSAFWSL